MTTDETHLLGAYFKHWRLQKGWPLEVIALKTRIPAKYLRALESNDFSALPPIEPVPHTLGESLREYRERQGLSIESIAERTRVPLASLHALEANNFKNLPEAPVIIRAFVDAYLNCLTLQDTEKEIVLIQLAKMVDTVYTQPRQEAAGAPPPVGTGAPHRSSTPLAVQSDRLHNSALGVYISFTCWRTAFCRCTVSAGQVSLAYTKHLLSRAGSLSALAGRTSLAYADHLLNLARSLSAKAGRTAAHKLAACAVECMARIRPDGGWSTLWQHTRTGLTVGAQRIQRAVVLVCRNLAPLFQRLWVRHHPVGNELSSAHAPTAAPQTARPLEGKTWVWLVQYGITVLLLLMLGSTASTIPLFKDTALAGTQLTASNLVAFIGYGGALLMVWLMSRKALAQLLPNRSAFGFLRPLGAPFNSLLGVSASYKLLLTLLGPSLGKADRLAYNWIFVSLVLAATLWLIRTWFLKSAPLLDSLDATDHSNRPGGIAVASLRD
jgi:transcriptional regulator with XRE-family HTH domain